ncbi:MAG: hypothetical protein U0U67_05105 [Chitinophagales bacterium]
MLTETLKDKLHTLINQVQDESVLIAYSTLLEKEIERENNNIDFWNDLPNNIKDDLELSLQDSKNNAKGKNAFEYLSQLKK